MTDDNLPLMQRKLLQGRSREIPGRHPKHQCKSPDSPKPLYHRRNRPARKLRVNLQNVTQTFGALTTSVIMDFEKMGTREEEGEAPPDAETK